MESLEMMFTQKNLMTVCCAAVLAFGLAACGSSSDDDNVAVTTPMNGGDGDADATDGDGDRRRRRRCRDASRNPRRSTSRL